MGSRIGSRLEPADLTDVLLRAACYLHEGNELAALELLLSAEVEFIPEHDYTSETNWHEHVPDTFVLHGPRKLVESHRDSAEEWKQVGQALEAAYGNHVLRSRYKPAQAVSQPWREVLTRELPSLGAIEAEYTEAQPE